MLNWLAFGHRHSSRVLDFAVLNLPLPNLWNGTRLRSTKDDNRCSEAIGIAV